MKFIDAADLPPASFLPVAALEVLAYRYELASARSKDGEYSGWRTYLSPTPPCVSEGSVRNLTPLYAICVE